MLVQVYVSLLPSGVHYVSLVDREDRQEGTSIGTSIFEYSRNPRAHSLSKAGSSMSVFPTRILSATCEHSVYAFMVRALTAVL